MKRLSVLFLFSGLFLVPCASRAGIVVHVKNWDATYTVNVNWQFGAQNGSWAGLTSIAPGATVVQDVGNGNAGDTVIFDDGNHNVLLTSINPGSINVPSNGRGSCTYPAPAFDLYLEYGTPPTQVYKCSAAVKNLDSIPRTFGYFTNGYLAYSTVLNPGDTFSATVSFTNTPVTCFIRTVDTDTGLGDIMSGGTCATNGNPSFTTNGVFSNVPQQYGGGTNNINWDNPGTGTASDSTLRQGFSALYDLGSKQAQLMGQGFEGVAKESTLGSFKSQNHSDLAGVSSTVAAGAGVVSNGIFGMEGKIIAIGANASNDLSDIAYKLAKIDTNTAKAASNVVGSFVISNQFTFSPSNYVGLSLSNDISVGVTNDIMISNLFNPQIVVTNTGLSTNDIGFLKGTASNAVSWITAFASSNAAAISGMITQAIGMVTLENPELGHGDASEDLGWDVTIREAKGTQQALIMPFRFGNVDRTLWTLARSLVAGIIWFLAYKRLLSYVQDRVDGVLSQRQLQGCQETFMGTNLSAATALGYSVAITVFLLIAVGCCSTMLISSGAKWNDVARTGGALLEFASSMYWRVMTQLIPLDHMVGAGITVAVGRYIVAWPAFMVVRAIIFYLFV